MAAERAHEIFAYRSFDFDCVLRIWLLGGRWHRPLARIRPAIRISSATIRRFTRRGFLLYFYSANLSLVAPFAIVYSAMSALQEAAGWLSYHRSPLATPSYRLFAVSETHRALVEEASGDRCFQGDAECAIELA